MPNERALRAGEEFNRFAERTQTPAGCDPTLAFTKPELAQAAQLWQRKAGSALPQRADFGPHMLRPYLPNVVIVDVVERRPAARRFRLRLMGTAIASLYGEHTGKFVEEAVVAPFAERWSAVMSATVAACAPLRFFGSVGHHGRDYLSMEFIFMPFGRRDLVEGLLGIGYAEFSSRQVLEPRVRETVSKPAPTASARSA